MTPISVKRFLEHVQDPIGLRLIAGEAGLSRELRSSRIQKPGLALAGFTSFVHQDRVQILGQTELSYLQTLAPEAQRRSIATYLACEVACLVVTKGLLPPEALIRGAEQTETPLFLTQMTSSKAIRRLLTYLDDLLSPRCRLHGVLLDVDGVGLLLTGESGIGKSECALALVSRGHRLVADDRVEVRRRGEDLVGQASRMIQNLIEVRGLGIINVSELFGVAATREHKRIELHIELEHWKKEGNYERTGLNDRYRTILGAKVASLLVPIHPGRNVADIVEVAARNFLLRMRGHHAARELEHRLHALDPRELGLSGEVEGINDHIQDEVE